MSFRYIAGLLGKSPTVVGPVDGEGGSAPGAWNLASQANLQALGTWPKPILDKYLWTWGRNNNGQLGLGNTTNYSSPKQVGALITWSKIASGGSFTISTKTDGTLWSWGRNVRGELGLNNATYYSSPKQVGSLTTWLNIAAGYEHTMATKTLELGSKQRRSVRVR